MTTNNEQKRSDVGPSNIPSIKDTQELIHVNYHYIQTTDNIRMAIEDIFEKYIYIGDLLYQAKTEKLYLANEYKNIYEYAKSEFELSKTTTKNLIAIRIKFCDENGNILDKYEHFSFSNLIELLPVEEKDIDSFVPTMTVKQMRSKKLELKINQQVDQHFHEEGFFSDIIDRVKAFNWMEALYRDSITVTATVDKEPYAPGEDVNWNTGEYKFLIMFKIDVKGQVFKFELKVDVRKLSMVFNSYDPYMYIGIDEEYDVEKACEQVASKIAPYLTEISDEADTSEDAAKESKEELSPGIYPLSNLVPRWDLESYDSLVKQEIVNLGHNYYYEDNGRCSITIFELPKRHKKNNPALYEIKHMDDPRKTMIINCASKEEFKLFDDIDDYLSKHLLKLHDIIA
jgi:hypothetical protein